MRSTIKQRARYTGAWAAAGAAGTIVMGGTPIGVVVVAGIAGALAWRTRAAA